MKRPVAGPPTSPTVAVPSSAVFGKIQYSASTRRAAHSFDIAAAILLCATRIAEKKKIAYVAMRDTPVEDVTTTIRATATDSVQPISNALYSLYGMVPRMPLLSLTGLPQRPEAFGELPSGVVPLPFDEIAGGQPGGHGHAMLVDAIDTLDRALLGVAHPVEHRFLRTESRRGWLYRGPDGEPVGYGYAGESGRLGPVAVRDPALLAPVLGHLTAAIVPRGAFAMWVGGPADRALVPALQAGFRLDPFPVLLCQRPGRKGATRRTRAFPLSAM